MEHWGFPAPPPGGGYLVLNSVQLGCLDLLCLIKTIYPTTKIIVQQPIPMTAAGPPPPPDRLVVLWA